jgi:FlaA1/EpsC-like NDP-sugar epimerase
MADGPVRRSLIKLVGLGRYAKRSILAVHDFTLMSLALWIAFSVRYGEMYVPSSVSFGLLMAAAPAIGVLTFFQFGIYRMVTRFMGGGAINRIAIATALSIVIWAMVVFMTGMIGVPRVSLFIYAAISIAAIWGSRQIGGSLLKAVGVPIPQRTDFNRLPVVVYGAGPAGIALASALERSDRYLPVAFVDRTRTLWGQYVGGYKVYRPDRLAGIIDRQGIKEVMVALSNDTSRQERLSVLLELERLAVAVRTLPAIEDIASGRVTVSDLRAVDATDLLGRDPVPANPDLLARNTTDKCVMVTGAGGSIGSELVRQIIRQAPRRLVLFELGENALYEIEAEVKAILASMQNLQLGKPVKPKLPEIVSVLGSVLNAQLVRETIETCNVQTIYHAAAYKHVPIVERNVISGLQNNTFGTIAIAQVAASLGVERFVLISTDKAVRPSSAMGASKRLAEMSLQALASQPSTQTVFTMVRFGNVLDSSGSVVRLFRHQIAKGGPVTVTHPDMIRYFMSIPEAASLVIQAGAMARGGEVFVLDMGEPVKIDNLARSMIRLMGLEVRDAKHPNGDIAIEYIGLREGEKMKEELLIGLDTMGTEHARIQTSREPFLPPQVLERELVALQAAIAAGDLLLIHDILRRTVEGYRSTPVNPSDTIDTLDANYWPDSQSRMIH